MKEYPKNYEWMANLSPEDITWMTEVIAIALDDNSVFEPSSDEPTLHLAKLLSEDKGPSEGKLEERYYHAAKALGITNAGQYMNHWEIIKSIATSNLK